jgi:UDP-N-acetylglucosamine 3-dehydrogenase
MLKKIGYGVIGGGQFGELHARCLAELPIVDLVAVCSRRPERARELAEKYGARRHYTDYHALLADEEIQAVHIVTAETDHREPTVAAAQAGKHILLEKPIAMSLEDADAMIAAAEAARIIFQVAHILRFDPRYVMAKEEIERGAVGQIVSMYARRNIPARVSAHYLKRVSSLVDDALHDTDLMLWYSQDRITEVYARGNSVRGLPHPDVAWCMHQFSRGALGVCEDAWFLPDKTPFTIDARLEVIGTEGALYVDMGEKGMAVHDRDGVRFPDPLHWPIYRDRVGGTLKEEIRYFAECLLTETPPQIQDPREARAALEAVLAADRSMQTGLPVKLPLP